MVGVTDYNGPFASAVRSGNVIGTQFHPEKSHQWGIRLLKNFAELKDSEESGVRSEESGVRREE